MTCDGLEKNCCDAVAVGVPACNNQPAPACAFNKVVIYNDRLQKGCSTTPSTTDCVENQDCGQWSEWKCKSFLKSDGTYRCKASLRTIPAINFEMIIEEVFEVEDGAQLKPNLKPGAKIHDGIKKRIFIYGHSPEDMLKILSDEEKN